MRKELFRTAVSRLYLGPSSLKSLVLKALAPGRRAGWRSGRSSARRPRWSRCWSRRGGAARSWACCARSRAAGCCSCCRRTRGCRAASCGRPTCRPHSSASSRRGSVVAETGPGVGPCGRARRAFVQKCLICRPRAGGGRAAELPRCFTAPAIPSRARKLALRSG